MQSLEETIKQAVERSFAAGMDHVLIFGVKMDAAKAHRTAKKLREKTALQYDSVLKLLAQKAVKDVASALLKRLSK